MDDAALIEAWIGLNDAALSTVPRYRGGPMARRHIREFVTSAVCRARLEGQLSTRVVDGRLTAAVAAYPDPGSWYGVPVHAVAVTIDDAAPGAAGWLVERLRALAAERGVVGLDLHLYTAWRRAIDAVLSAELGLGIDSVVLVGATEPALAALVAKYDPPRDLSVFGLDAGRPRDVAEVDAVVALERRVFERWPAYCWFGASPQALARTRGTLLDALRGEGGMSVIRRGDEALGYVHFGVEHDAPFWGPAAGVGLLLDPSLWGRGLVKTLYRVGLERLVEQGVGVFKGGTAQPPVLGLGRLMGRAALGVHLRAGVPFDRAHFQGFV